MAEFTPTADTAHLGGPEDLCCGEQVEERLTGVVESLGQHTEAPHGPAARSAITWGITHELATTI